MPMIKVVPPVRQTEIPSVVHAYQPDEVEPEFVAPEPVAPTEAPAPNQRKTVGSMYEEEFIEVMIKAIIQAEQVKASLNEEPKEPEAEKGPVAKVLGTIGDVAHGIIDIAEGGVRGIVDVCTVGNARRK